MKNCDICKKRHPQVEISVFVNEELIKMHICPACAEECKLDFNAVENGTVPEFIEHCLALRESKKPNPEADTLSCPDCGMTGEQFEANGQFGCSLCYTVFMPLIKERNHDGPIPEHRGKSPDKPTGDSLLSLQQSLEQAVAREAYEEAAIIRDKMIALREEQTELETH